MPLDGPSPKSPYSLGSHVETIPHGTIADERLRIVSQRLTLGFYDKPEVIDRIAAKVGAELANVG